MQLKHEKINDLHEKITIKSSYERSKKKRVEKKERKRKGCKMRKNNFFVALQWEREKDKNAGFCLLLLEYLFPLARKENSLTVLYTALGKVWVDSSFFITLYMLTWHGIHPTLSSPQCIVIVWQAATLKAHSLHWFFFWGPSDLTPANSAQHRVIALEKLYPIFFLGYKHFNKHHIHFQSLQLQP